MVPARFTNLDAARARFGDRVDRLAPYLSRVDEPAARVVEALEALRPEGRGWAMFNQAIERGIDTVDGAPEAFRAFFAEVDRVPPWVDWPTLDRGGELLMRAGPLGGMVLGARSLVQGYLSPGGNKPLVFSGRLKEQAPRRLDETARYVQAVCRPGGLRRFADGFKITLKVRIMHAQVQRLVVRSGQWDAARWGAPVNLHDITGTSLLFSACVIDGLRQLGLTTSADETESYFQLWRYASILMGSAPELTPASEFEARQLGELLAATQGPPDDDSRALVHALLDSPIARAKTPAAARQARVQRELACGLVRGFYGDALADTLAVPRTRWRYAVPAIRRLTGLTEQVRRRSRTAHRAAIASGHRYWDRVIEIGLAGATAEFRPPERLALAG